MAKQERYFIGPSLLGDIREVIDRVGNMPSRTAGADFSPRLQSLSRPSGSFMVLGKTQSTWTKGTTASIYIYDEGTPPNETNPGQPVIEGAVNKFADVQADKWVMLGRTRLGWYLISAEC